jgi:hypothetical protein
MSLSSSYARRISWLRRQGLAGAGNCGSFNASSLVRALASAIYALAVAISACVAPVTASAIELSQPWSGAPGIRITPLEVAAVGTGAYLLVWFVLLTIIVIWDFCSGSKRASVPKPRSTAETAARSVQPAHVERC